MADLLASYNALSPSSSRTDVAKVLNALISAPIDDSSREALVAALVSDIASCKPGSTSGRLHHTGTYPCSYFRGWLQQSAVS